MKKTIILKIFLTLLLLAVLFLKVNIFEILRIACTLDLIYIFGALILVPILYIVRATRWNMFLYSVGIIVPFHISLEVLLIGNFYGLITPGKIGELGRAYHISEEKVLTIPTIIIEKIIDIFTLVCLSLITIVIYFQDNSFMQIGILLCTLAIFLGIFLLINKKFIFFTAKFFNIEREDCKKFFENSQKILYNFPLLAGAFLLSLVYYSLCYLIGYFIILSAGFNPMAVITLPIIILMGNIPLTISGLGLRESIGSLTFLILGESAANGFIFSFLLFLLITLVPSIFGYFLILKVK